MSTKFVPLPEVSLSPALYPTRNATVSGTEPRVLQTESELAKAPHMNSAQLDIFRKDIQGNPVWLDCVKDLETARCRLNELASAIPGEYFVFDQRTHQIVASLVRPTFCKEEA